MSFSPIEMWELPLFNTALPSYQRWEGSPFRHSLLSHDSYNFITFFSTGISVNNTCSKQSNSTTCVVPFGSCDAWTLFYLQLLRSRLTSYCTISCLSLLILLKRPYKVKYETLWQNNSSRSSALCSTYLYWNKASPNPSFAIKKTAGCPGYRWNPGI